ncbi:AFR668Wp [Eremothecium gossypii ATCC 10895]|uniref:AFR668Wp n=1 Tax=Eremothecium gossypii (strain ATCC 10895 / CBS 109.51 / FGSC 9923 / NRRL Y-1056) TaxID=284811 RepID=Q752A7_EREGS|nr:AFR668Wp [Eremothecium gossypii ATCC 10895]AAS54040.1 AFR668Wp [Eremothecium gossypii ATCC 10895]AEY98355.1 FAFR668Wp [Eremothecium gossypii FDAG1]
MTNIIYEPKGDGSSSSTITAKPGAIKAEVLNHNTSEVESLCEKPNQSDVKRELKPRHVTMISLGGTIGTGLFIGIASPIRNAGPVGSLLAYIFVATMAYCVTQSLGEMATFIPVTSSFTVFASRFVSPALGAANGYLYWLSWCITFALEISVIGRLILYWSDAVPITAWMAIFWVLLTAINLIPVKFYGEFEFWIASLKVIAILCFLFYGLVVVCGGSKLGRIGFRYWKDPGPWGVGIVSQEIHTAQFLGWVSSLIKAAFTFQGTELVGVTAGETKNPRRTVPKAINTVFFRILLFYIGSLLVIGLLVRYDDPQLIQDGSTTNANASPFVVAINAAGTKVLPDIMNGVIMVTIISAGNSNIYVGSRVLYGLGRSGLAPAFISRTTSRGVPYVAVLATSMFGALGYLNVSSKSGSVFDWLLSITAVSGFFTWLLISVSHIRFMQCLKKRGISRDDLPFKAKFMPYGAYYAAFFVIVIILVQGFTAFTPFSAVDFVAYYISAFIFVVIWLLFQFLFKGRWFHTVDEIDIDTDRRDIDAIIWDDDKPTTLWGKIWYHLS